VGTAQVGSLSQPAALPVGMGEQPSAKKPRQMASRPQRHSGAAAPVPQPARAGHAGTGAARGDAATPLPSPASASDSPPGSPVRAHPAVFLRRSFVERADQGVGGATIALQTRCPAAPLCLAPLRHSTLPCLQAAMLMQLARAAAEVAAEAAPEGEVGPRPVGSKRKAGEQSDSAPPLSQQVPPRGNRGDAVAGQLGGLSALAHESGAGNKHRKTCGFYFAVL